MGFGTVYIGKWVNRYNGLLQLKGLTHSYKLNDGLMYDGTLAGIGRVRICDIGIQKTDGFWYD